MTDDEILTAFDCDFPFPREALLAATASRATLAPRLIADIERYIANPADPVNRPIVLLFAFHLLGEWREKAAYPSLCRLMRLPDEHLRPVLDDALMETSHRVLAAVFDGDPRPLHDLILDEKADEFARSSGCHALAMVTARGDMPIEQTEVFLREAFDRLRPRDINYVWCGWQNTVALLGLEALRPLARTAFKRFIDRTWTEYKFFEGDLTRALANDRAALKGGDRFYVPFVDTIDELGSWYGFSEEYHREADAGPTKEPIRWVSDETQGLPHTNPYRHVGRNDPCPCGSGLKFKRCHGKD